MHWASISFRYLQNYLGTKRGIALAFIIIVLNSLMLTLSIGVYYMTMDDPQNLAPTQLHALRNKVNTGSLLLLLWIIAVAYEGGYLFKNQLFQRFLLNGYSRWYWAHFLVLTLIAVSVVLAICQTVFINLIAGVMYDLHWLLSWGHILKLTVAYIFASLFSLFWVVLFPRIALLITLAWITFETILSELLIKKFALFLYPILPFPSLFNWLGDPNIQKVSALLVIAYFLVFLCTIYFFINKRSYG